MRGRFLLAFELQGGSGSAAGPNYQRTPSIVAALDAELPGQLYGVNYFHTSKRRPTLFKMSVRKGSHSS